MHVSAATAWELATKTRLGKWPQAEALAGRLTHVINACKFLQLPITVEHGRRAGSLLGAHKDPFDRMLAAQAHLEDMRLVTADPAFEIFGTRVLW